MTKGKELRPFGMRDKVGYMFGNFANDFTFTFASIYLMVFYTKVLGVDAGIVGTMFVISRFLDAFTDIGMGRIADKRKPSKGGKFRPWLMWMCAPVALASFLMYQYSLVNVSMTIRVVYMFVTYILWGSIFYTAINIPYGSMASVLSAEADDRASLSTFRSIGSVVTNVIIGVGAPMLIYTTDAAGNEIVQGPQFTLVAGIFSVATIICYLICYYTTTERVELTVDENEKGASIVDTLKALVTSRAMIGVVLGTICVIAAQLLNQTINQYLFIDYFKNKSGVSIMSAVSMLPGFLLAPFAVPLSKKFGKKELGVFGGLCGAAACFLLFVLKTKSMWMYIVINVIGFLGFGVYNLIMWAFITDIIDDQEVRTGQREDGTIYGAYSFARKIGQSIAGGLGGWTLQWIGYNSAVQVQTEAVTTGIYNIATLIPAILYALLALSLLFIYPLNKKKVEENIEILKKKHGNA